jgi:hypothetical protein
VRRRTEIAAKDRKRLMHAEININGARLFLAEHRGHCWRFAHPPPEKAGYSVVPASELASASRDPYAVASRFGIVAGAFCSHRGQGYGSRRSPDDRRVVDKNPLSACRHRA